jgi:phosphatidylserine/phosphatidylglycerophosphate/cardiolipin synthase-like enzyme
MAVDVRRHIGARRQDATSRWHQLRRRYKWWQLALFAIGVISFVSVMSGLFFAVGYKPSRVHPDSAVPGVDSSQFATALSAIVGAPVENGGTVTVLNNGDEFVPALLQSIADATRTINFTVYIWSEGDERQEAAGARAETT